MILFDGQVPEAILEDDRHLVGIFGDQMARNRDAGRLRLEGDIEMMLAGQAVAAHDLRQHAADHGAQRILHDFVIGNQAVADVFTHGRGGWTARARRSSGESRLATRKIRSEEHTSELQSLMRTSYAVFCLQKKKPSNNQKVTLYRLSQ